MDNTELDPSQAQLVARLAQIQAAKAELEVEEAELKAKLAQQLPYGAYNIDGKPALSVSVGRRFDPALAAQILPPELAALCQATVIDSRRAKEVLPPALYSQCQKENGNPTVRLY